MLYLRTLTDAEIVIAEGTGDINHDTDYVFQKLGYSELSKEIDVPLIDLNIAPLVKLENSSLRIFKELYIPEIVMESYLISVPVLKAHSLAVITGSMKSMQT